jgi:hypothetical protein
MNATLSNAAAIVNRPAAEFAAHCVMLQINGFKAQIKRAAYCFGTLKRADAADLLVGVDWALERGYLSHGTKNASAKLHSRGESEKMLYITKAGKAWLRTFGSDFGSAGVYYAQIATVAPGYAKQAFVVTEAAL